MNRKSLREQIFKLLFRTEFNDPAEMDEQAAFFFESGDMTVTDKDREYITGKCKKIVEKIGEIDGALDEKLEGWTVSRLPKVELAILLSWARSSEKTVPARLLTVSLPGSPARRGAGRLLPARRLPARAAV